MGSYDRCVETIRKYKVMAMDTKQFVEAMLTLIENASHRKLKFSSMIRGGHVTGVEAYLCELIDGRIKSDPRVIELVEAARELLVTHPRGPHDRRLAAALAPFEEAK